MIVMKIVHVENANSDDHDNEDYVNYDCDHCNDFLTVTMMMIKLTVMMTTVTMMLLLMIMVTMVTCDLAGKLVEKLC